MPGIRELISFLGQRDRRLCFGGTGRLKFSTQEGNLISSDQIPEVAPLLDKMTFPRRWELMGNAPKSGERDSSDSLTIYIDHDYAGTLITVGSNDNDLLAAVFRQLEHSFGFQQVPLGLRQIKLAAHATALIGCHFDDAGKKAAQRLQKFLSLVGFARVDIADVVRNATIPDKVGEFIDKNAFYIGIVTGQRDHAWISAESAYALARNKEVMLILQQGVKFDPTFFGHDREHLSFTNIIDESFIGILEDFRSRDVLGLR